MKNPTDECRVRDTHDRTTLYTPIYYPLTPFVLRTHSRPFSPYDTPAVRPASNGGGGAIMFCEQSNLLGIVAVPALCAGCPRFLLHITPGSGGRVDRRPRWPMNAMTSQLFEFRGGRQTADAQACLAVEYQLTKYRIIRLDNLCCRYLIF